MLFGVSGLLLLLLVDCRPRIQDKPATTAPILATAARYCRTANYLGSAPCLPPSLPCRPPPLPCLPPPLPSRPPLPPATAAPPSAASSPCSPPSACPGTTPGSQTQAAPGGEGGGGAQPGSNSGSKNRRGSFVAPPPPHTKLVHPRRKLAAAPA